MRAITQAPVTGGGGKVPDQKLFREFRKKYSVMQGTAQGM
jgi:hypothetical protein